MPKDFKQMVKDALDQLKIIGEDLSSLQVTTVTGDVSIIVKGEGNNKKIDLNNIFNDLLTTDNASGKIELLAHTDVKFDQDVVQFVKKDLTTNDEKLLVLHKDTVIASTQARIAFLTFMQNVVKL